MPYEVFANALFTTPGRLLGMEPILNQKARGLHGQGWLALGWHFSHYVVVV